MWIQNSVPLSYLIAWQEEMQLSIKDTMQIQNIFERNSVKISIKSFLLCGLATVSETLPLKSHLKYTNKRCHIKFANVKNRTVF